MAGALLMVKVRKSVQKGGPMCAFRLFYGHHHVDVGRVELECAAHVVGGAHWRCWLQKHESVVVHAAVMVEVEGVQHHLV